MFKIKTSSARKPYIFNYVFLVFISVCLSGCITLFVSSKAEQVDCEKPED